MTRQRSVSLNRYKASLQRCLALSKKADVSPLCSFGDITGLFDYLVGALREQLGSARPSLLTIAAGSVGCSE